MKVEELRRRRMQSDIPGSVVALRAGLSRSKLSALERGYVCATEDEIARIDAALDELIAAREAADQVLAANGWPGIRTMGATS